MSAFTYNLNADDEAVFPISFHTACAHHVQESVRRSSGASIDQILLVLEGSGTLNCQGQSYNLKAGSAFFVGRGCPVEYLDDGGLVSAFITFKGQAVDSILDFYGCDGFLYREGYHVQRYTDKINEMIELYYNGKSRGRLSAKVYAFVIEFFEGRKNKSTPADDVAAYIQQNFGKKLTVSELAGVANCCVSKLCQDFKKQYGCSAIEYLLDVRLRYARDMLSNDPDVAVKTAALSCGFEDVSYFCRAYKKKFGVTPTEDR